MKIQHLINSTNATQKDALTVNVSAGQNSSLRIKDVNRVANKIQEAGFPTIFSLTLITTGDKSFNFDYELIQKEINDDNNWHQLIFTYEITSESYVKLKQIRDDLEDSLEAGKDDVEDELDELTNIHTFSIFGEFKNEFTKVYGELH